ncbi:MAG: uncharacterized protein QOG46_2644 [Pseudonocardiales bacterium]|nr:uncharacterized protein [Pseudonocardiales bacterium]
MIELLQERPAWFVLGPLIGLVVIGLLATINQRIGVLGGYSNVVERATGRTGELGWKAWFLFGVLGGGLLFRVLAGSSTVSDGYGWLTRTFTDPVAAAVLVVAGAAIGFGAKYAGGCTSGNGLGGTSFGSAASFVATGTFMAVAVGASFLLRAIT